MRLSAVTLVRPLRKILLRSLGNWSHDGTMGGMMVAVGGTATREIGDLPMMKIRVKVRTRRQLAALRPYDLGLAVVIGPYVGRMA